MSHYEFAGIMAANNFATLHVTSTNFDEPICNALVTSSRRCLSFHGYSGTDDLAETSIGGLDTVMKGRVAGALTQAGFRVITAAQEISGSDPANIANKTTTGMGVQVEMSNALRASFFPNGDLSRSMRDSGQRTKAFTAYVGALRSVFGQGQVSMGSINVSRWTTVPWASADLDITALMGTDKLATGGSHFLHHADRHPDPAQARRRDRDPPRDRRQHRQPDARRRRPVRGPLPDHGQHAQREDLAGGNQRAGGLVRHHDRHEFLGGRRHRHPVDPVERQHQHPARGGVVCGLPAADTTEVHRGPLGQRHRQGTGRGR
jgi:phage replication-related protein YjqB (UPF0714/DUF867 family)